MDAGALRAPVVDLIHTLYDQRRRDGHPGGLTEAEANWVLRIVLPVYGLTVDDLVRHLRTGVTG